ncbi:MAG: ADP-ribosylglycohydrolase family protein, partial [Acidobacteriota bacterium]
AAALAYPAREDVLHHGARLAAMTHWSPQSELACHIYALWVHHLLAGDDIAAGWHAALDTARALHTYGDPLAPDTPGPGPVPDDFFQRLAHVDDLRYDDLQPSGYAGYCVECLEAVAWCCLNRRRAPRVIVDAANLGGESDTIAALAGGIAGAAWGVGALPDLWLDGLDDAARLDDLARDLAQLRAARR